MNKTIKSVLLLIGLVLVGYGIYTLIQPETHVAIGDVDLIKAQENTDSYITIGIGIVAIAIALIAGKK